MPPWHKRLDLVQPYYIGGCLLGDPEVTIAQCRSGGITVAMVAQAHVADNVVHDKEDSGGPPLPYQGYPVWALLFFFIRLNQVNEMLTVKD